MRKAAGLLTLALLTAACGSTVPAAQRARVSASGDASLGGPNPSTLSTEGATGADTATAGGSGAQVLAGAGKRATATTTRATVPPISSATGRGVTATQVYIGYSSARDLAAVAGTSGIAGAELGDGDAQIKAVVDDVNRTGGLLGRKIVLVNHDFKTLESTSNPAAAGAAACNSWTVDNKVFAVIDPVGTAGELGLTTCLAKAGTPLITNSALGEKDYAAAPLMASPSVMTIDRYLNALVDRLVAQKFFIGWDNSLGRPNPAAPVKIGTQSFDTPTGRHYVEVLRAALARNKLKLDEVEAHGTDLTANASSTQAAVLRFKAQGVTHMFNANLLFYQGANSQHYTPRYAVDDTIDTPQLLAKNVGKDQLHGSMGAGFQPLNEVENYGSVSAAHDKCIALMKNAGQKTDTQFTRGVMGGVCDLVYVLAAAVRKGGALTNAGYATGLNGLAGSFPSAVTYSTTFATARHYGASGVRDFVYDDSCSCYVFPDKVVHPA
jgi:ABC-type branched-subunit amino acid transport system substrate-binding protein